MDGTEDLHDVVLVLHVEIVELRSQDSEHYDHKESFADVAVRHLLFFIVLISLNQGLRREEL